MEYSESFKRRVAETFPGDIRIQELLDSGSPAVGRILDDASYLPFDAEEIVRLFDDDNADEVYIKASQAVERQRLHMEWQKAYR